MLPTDPLRPVIPDNARPLRLTAAAGTKLAGAILLSTVIILLNQRVLQLESLHHSCSIAGSSFRSLSKIPHCWLQMKPGPCLSPSVAVQPLRTAKDHRLGRLLPKYQLPNPTQAHLLAKNFLWLFRILSWTKRQIPVCYSPVRHGELFSVRLACVKHTTSVHPEPGSNSIISQFPYIDKEIYLHKNPSHIIKVINIF